MDLFREIAEARSGARPAALCIVVQTRGSTPRKAGAKMLVYGNGTTSGSVGGGNFEKEVVENARHQLKEGKPRLFRHDLLPQHQMCCGGSVDVYIEPIHRMKPLYIFGAGHVGKVLAQLAPLAEFEVHVIDDRQDQLEQVTGASIHKLGGPTREVLPRIAFDGTAFIVIMTCDHALDREILAHCINQPHAYLGMIGSRRKALVATNLLIQSGAATEEQLAAVRMPIGKSIAAETPEEIAISILAEMIEAKNTACVTT